MHDGRHNPDDETQFGAPYVFSPASYQVDKGEANARRVKAIFTQSSASGFRPHRRSEWQWLHPSAYLQCISIGPVFSCVVGRLKSGTQGTLSRVTIKVQNRSQSRQQAYTDGRVSSSDLERPLTVIDSSGPSVSTSRKLDYHEGLQGGIQRIPVYRR